MKKFFSESYKFYGMYRMECTQSAIKIKEHKSRASKILYILNKEARVKKALKKLDRKDIAEIRSKYFSYKKSGKIKEKIWIISDRVENAGDNAINFTDDCALIENMGGEVEVVKGSDENIKLTTPLDVIIAESILRARKQ